MGCGEQRAQPHMASSMLFSMKFMQRAQGHAGLCAVLAATVLCAGTCEKLRAVAGRGQCTATHALG